MRFLTAAVMAMMLTAPGCGTSAYAHHWDGGHYDRGGDWGHRGRMWYGRGRGGYGYRDYGRGYRRYYHNGRYYWIPLAMLGAAAVGAIMWNNYQSVPQNLVPDNTYPQGGTVINNYGR